MKKYTKTETTNHRRRRQYGVAVRQGLYNDWSMESITAADGVIKWGSSRHAERPPIFGYNVPGFQAVSPTRRQTFFVHFQLGFIL